MSAEYSHNSIEKKKIRQRWIDFTKKLNSRPKKDFTMLCLTTETLDDLQLFEKEGFFETEETETGLLNLIRGRFFCVESCGKTKTLLIKKLPNGSAISGEIGHEIGKEHSEVFTNLGNPRWFPCDVINLDFTQSIGRLSKRGIIRVIKWIFELQAKYKKSFSFFITFADTTSENEDVISEFRDILQENINNTQIKFKDRFEQKFSSIEELERIDYPRFLSIGLAKCLVKSSSENKFELSDIESYVYQKARFKMVSQLFNLKYIKKTISPMQLYTKDCLKCLNEISFVSNTESQ